MNTAVPNARFRRLLAVAGSVYFLWWFALDWAIPTGYNPFFSRLAVALTPLAVLGASYVSSWCLRHIGFLFYGCLWLITLHYFYIFFVNGVDLNWIIGSYITVVAISIGFFSRRALLYYSLFVITISVCLILLLPGLFHTIFLPGILTIFLQANIGLTTHLVIIKKLRASNMGFQLLFNSTFEGIVVHDNTRVILVNDAILNMTGYTREEMLGRNMLEVVAPSERASVIQGMASEEVGPYELTVISKHGEALNLEIRAKNFIYEGRRVRLVTAQSIRDRKRAESERIHALAMAENVRIRDEFISIASHELKTPLSSLKLQSDLIERDFKKRISPTFSEKRSNDATQVFNRQVNRLIELVETMLDASRISIGRMVLECEPVDLVKKVREITEAHAPYDFQIDSPCPVVISADSGRIGQVIENLVANAIKYGEGKPVRISIRKDAGDAVLTIRDHGIGIAPDYIKRIFERFERAISSAKISGLGLGLYIAQKIVEAHGGVIICQSQIGKGSTFTVRLP